METRFRYNSLFVMFILFVLTTGVSAQEFLSGKVFNGHSSTPLAKATVRMGNRNVKTDASGTFKLPLNKDENFEASASGFHDYTRRLEDLPDLTGIAVYLVAKPEIEGLNITKNAVGVYEPNFEYIFDFEFIDGLLVTGTYLNRKINARSKYDILKNCAVTIFEKGEMTGRELVPDFPIRFRKSAFNQLYIEGLDYAVQIYEEEGKPKTKEITYEGYLDQVLPWTVAFSESAFRVTIVPEIPQVVHYCYRTDYQEDRVARIARNEKYFETTFGDYEKLSPSQADLADELSAEQGFNQKLYASYIRSNGSRRSRTSVTRDLRHPYTPAYRQNDDLFIIDAMNRWIYRHDAFGTVKDSVYFPVNIPGEELWQVVQDQVTKEIYVVHVRKGVYYVRPLDMATGALGKPTKVAYPFPEKLKIYNGSAFYVRHDAKDKFKHLYRQPLDF